MARKHEKQSKTPSSLAAEEMIIRITSGQMVIIRRKRWQRMLGR